MPTSASTSSTQGSNCGTDWVVDGGRGDERGPPSFRFSGPDRVAEPRGAEAPAEYALLATAAKAALDPPSENNMVARTSKGMIRAGDVGPDEVRT